MGVIDAAISVGSEPFWEGLKANQLRLQRCHACGYLRYPIRWCCPECLSEDFIWELMSGGGRVETFVWYLELLEAVETIVPEVGLAVPYNVAAIRLAEGPLIFANVIGVDFGNLSVGDVVTATFPRVGSHALLRFTTAARSGADIGEVRHVSYLV